MSEEALQKKAIEELNESEKSVLEVLAKVPLNLHTSTRWLNMARDSIQTGFMCAKRAVTHPGDK